MWTHCSLLIMYYQYRTASLKNFQNMRLSHHVLWQKLTSGRNVLGHPQHWTRSRRSGPLIRPLRQVFPPKIQIRRKLSSGLCYVHYLAKKFVISITGTFHNTDSLVVRKKYFLIDLDLCVRKSRILDPDPCIMIENIGSSFYRIPKYLYFCIFYGNSCSFCKSVAL